MEVQLGAKVVGVDATGIDVEDPDGRRRRIEAVCKVWAAGVQASELGAQLAEQSGAEIDRAGRVQVNDDLTLPGHPEVFVVGDMASLKGYPGVAQVAIQGARYAADQIKRRLAGQEPRGPFEYHDKGSMATISRFSVASVGSLRLSGFTAWLLWLAVHLVYIIGFKHRLTTLLHWALSFIGRGRSERTVTEQQVFARTAIEDLGEEYAPRCRGCRGPQGAPAVGGPGARRGVTHRLSGLWGGSLRIPPDSPRVMVCRLLPVDPTTPASVVRAAGVAIAAPSPRVASCRWTTRSTRRRWPTACASSSRPTPVSPT